jgi:methionyl-tRNA formyltransferase
VKIVLISDGSMCVARQLHTLPGEPLGVIELTRKSVPMPVALMRKAKRILTFRKYGTLREYARYRGMKYCRLFKADKDALKAILLDWGCELVITSRCAVIPMEAVAHLRYGAINLHPSLLPSYRGGNPLFWQVHDQVEQIGVTVHYLAEKADRGAILAREAVPRPRCVESRDLSELLEAKIGVKLLKSLIPRIRDGTADARMQPEQSPTRRARNFPLKDFHQYVDVDQLNLEALHDLAAFFGEWPAAVGKYEGWQAWSKWVPKERVYERHAATLSNGLLQLKGYNIWLTHRDGHITLSPRISARLMLEHFLSFR